MRKNVPLLVLGLLFLAFVAVIALQPQPLDWRPNLERTSAKPFGAEVFYRLVPEWLGTDVVPVQVPPFEFLADSSRAGTYFFLTTTFAPDEAETRRLLRFAERGNTVVVAADDLDGPLADTLGLPEALAEAYDEPPGLQSHWLGFRGEQDSTLHLAAPPLRRAGGYRYPFQVITYGLDGLDPDRTTVLGLTPDSVATLARVEVGAGAFVLASTPLAFSNAALTGAGDGPEYISGVLAYVPQQPLFWDAYYKPFKSGARTPLRVLLLNPALRWAFWLVVIGAMLFILFRGRRWQRPVPVVAPPPNAAVEFVRTVGRLYFHHGDAHQVVGRKLRFFFDRLRARLALADVDLSEETEQRVARRSGLPEEQVAALFARLRRARRARHLPPEELVELDRALDRFYSGIGEHD